MAMKQEFVDSICILLVKHKLFTQQEAAKLSKAFHESESALFDDFLLEEGLIEKEDLLKVLSEYYKVPSLDVVGYFFDHALLGNFPKDFLRRNALIPVEIDNDILVVVAANPQLDGLASAIERFTQNDVRFVVGIRLDIVESIDEFYDKALTEEIAEDIDLDEEHRLAEQEKRIEERNQSISPLDEE